MKGKSVLKRILSLALSAAMVVTMLPAQMAKAAEEDEPMPEKLMYFSFDGEAQADEDGKVWMDGGKAKGEVLGATGNLLISTSDKHDGAGALELRGSAWLQVVNKDNTEDNLLTGKTDLTISYWSKTTGAPGWGWSASKDNQQNNNNENYIGILDQPGSVSVERYLGGRKKPSIGTTEVTSGAWRFITVVLGASETVLYIDGQRKNSQSDPWPLTDILTNGSRLLIGRANWGSGGEFFNGLIDEFTVYDGALTANQVNACFYEAVKISTPSQIGIVKGNNKQLNVDIPSAIENPVVTYEVADKDVVTVDESGLITAVAAGETTVTAIAEFNNIRKTSTTAVKVADTGLGLKIASYGFESGEGEGTEKLIKGLGKYDGNAEFSDEGRNGGKALQTSGKYGLQLKETNIGSDYTISAWVKANSTLANHGPVIALGNTANWMTIAGHPGGNQNCKLWANNKTLLSNGEIVLPQGEWKMLTITQSGRKVNCYVNGKLAGTGEHDVDKMLDGSGTTICLGVNYWDPTFDGLYDDVNIYNVALDAGEVAIEYLKAATKEERGNYLGLTDENLACVTEDLDLPTDTNGIEIAWTSSDEKIISSVGKIAASEMDGSQVTLTAVATYKGEKVFEEAFTAILAADIIKKYVDAENNELQSGIAAEKQKVGSAYAYVPEENPSDNVIIKEGKAYVRNTEGSTFSIEKVGKDARTIIIKYDEAVIESVASPTDETFYTIEGNDPVLPSVVTGTTNANTKVDVPVEWTIGKLSVGDNTVTGIAAGKTVSAKVHVYPCDELVKGTGESNEVTADHNNGVHRLSNSYKGVVIAEYEIETTGTVSDGAVLYMDSVPGNADGVWGAGGAMLQFKNSTGYFVSRVGDGNGGATDFPASAEGALKYDANKVYKVRVEMDSNAKPGNYKIYITDPEGKVHQITQPNGNGFRKYNEGVIQSYYVGRSGFKIKNHKISWLSGYATKKLEYYIGGSTEPKVIEDVTKVMPGKLSYEEQVKETYEEDGKTYYLNPSKTGWVDGKDTPAEGENAVYRVYYEEAAINDQEVEVMTRPGIVPELPNEVDATYSSGLKRKEAVTWNTEEITEDKYDTLGKTFVVTGAFVNDSSAKLTAKVTVASKEEFLLAKYEFDGEGDAFLSDSTDNGKNGTKQGTVDAVPGMKGTAAYLNRGTQGTTSIKLPDNLLVGTDGKVQDKLTVSMFMRPEVDGNAFALTLHGADTDNYIGLINKPTEFSITYRKSGKADEQAKHTTGTERGKWIHVAFVADGTNLKLYKDGEMISSVPCTIKASDLKAQNNYIGYSMWRDNDDKGAFDEFEVYGVALTDEEIKAISDAGFEVQVDAVKDNIRTAFLEANKTEEGAAFDVANVTENIKLPNSMESSLQGLDIKVSWASSSTSIISTTGVVRRPNADTKVTLTPTITAGSYSVTADGIEVTVKESDNVNYERINGLLEDADAIYAAKEVKKVYTDESLAVVKKWITDAKSEKAAVEAAEKDNTATPAENKAHIKAVADTLEERLGKIDETLKLKNLVELNKSVLTASYPLASDAVDAAGKATAGTVAEKVTFSKKGYGGVAFVGDEKGKSMIDLPTGLFQGKDQLTISFWAKDDGPNTNNGRNQAVFSIGADTNKYMLVNTNRENRLRAVITTKGPGSANEMGYVDDDGAQVQFPKNTWAHLVLVFSDTQFSVYRNGILLGSRDTGIKISDLGELKVARIGNSVWSGSDNDYIGSVKDLRVFDASLEKEQIEAVYNNRKQLEAEEAVEELVDAMGAKVEGTSNVLAIPAGKVALPATGNQGEAISWATSDEAVINVTDKTAVVGTAELTATVSLNGITKEVKFQCTVLDTAELAALVAELKELVEADYTSVSWANLQEKLTVAEKALEDLISADALEKAFDDLKAAQNALVGIKVLKELISQFEAKHPEQGNYSMVTWEAYQTALEAAKEAVAKADASVNELENAEKNLRDAEGALKESNIAGLQQLIKKVEDAKYVQEEYTSTSWDALTMALKEAKEVDERAEQHVIEDAIKNLQTAVDGLVNIKALNEAIQKADEMLDSLGTDAAGNYTVASWNALVDSLENASAVAAKADAAQGEVDQAAKALEDAMGGLVSVAALREAIKKNEEIKKDSYTAATWKNFQDKIDAAKALLTQQTAVTKADIDAAIAAMDEAFGQLEESKKAELNKLIAEIEGMKDDYVKYGMDIVLKRASELDAEVPGDAGAAEVEAAIKELKDLMAEHLVSIVDLKAAVADAKAVVPNLSEYLADGKQEFADALEFAELILSKAQGGTENPSKVEIAAACTHLSMRMNALYRRSDLGDSIKNAESKLAEDKYTTASKNALAEAIANAKKVNEDANSAKKDFTDAEAALEEAISKLVEKADTSALRALVNEVRSYQEANYVAASWKHFQDALKRANDLLADDGSTQADLILAEENLRIAKDALVARASDAERSRLQSEIESANALEITNYTSDSWKKLQTALAKAEAAHAGEGKAEVAAALQELQAAENGLVNISALKAAIAEASKLAQEDYTTVTWPSFQNALAEANQTAQNGLATQSDVDAAIANLSAEKDKLVRVSNTTALSSLVAEVGSLTLADYTAATRAAFNTALEAAKQITPDNTQAEVDAAEKSLRDAWNGLVKIADKTDLNARIAELNAFTKDSAEEVKYTSDTWSALANLLKAMAEPTSVVNKEEATEQEVSDALQALEDAFTGLKVRGDKTTLNRHIAAAEEALKAPEYMYTSDSLNSLRTALAAAIKCRDEQPDALQAEVNSVSDALRDARYALVPATYQVTIDPANGTAATTSAVSAGSQVFEPVEPTRAGYDFAGWFVGGAEYDFGSIITADTAITAKWNALPSVAKATVTVAKAVYTGKARKPSVTVKLNGKTLDPGVDYTLKYSNNIKVGQATVTISGIEDYTGSKAVKFNIIPAKVKTVKLTNKKTRKMVVKFTKGTGVKGYQVTYSTNKNFKSAKNKNVTKNSATLSGLKKNTTYYVKVRAYANINGKKVYGAYSTKVKVTIKK